MLDMIVIKTITAQQTWPIRNTVMYPEKQLHEVILPNDADGTHFGLYEHDELVSVVSFFKDGNNAQLRKLATVAEKQGLGYGRTLLNYVIEHSKSLGAEKLWCNARKNKASFYKKLGFQETDKTYFQDGYHFVVMELHLKKDDQSRV